MADDPDAIVGKSLNGCDRAIGRPVVGDDNLVIVPGLGQAAPNGEANQRLTIKGCDADAECDHWILLRSFAPGISQQ